MEIKPVYEFLLWDNCNNHCKFCFQRDKCKDLTSKQKTSSLKRMRQFLESDKFKTGSHILLVGGEIFDDVSDDLKDCWWETVNYLGKKMNSKEIDLLYVNTNLLYEDLTLLEYLFNIIQYYGLWQRLKFTTSYDLVGRFANKRREKLFLDNLKLIKQQYPECNIVVNTILMKETCEQIINDKFNPKKFCDEYQCDINLIPYIVYTEDLSATPSQMIKALMHTDYLIDGYFGRYYHNMNLDQDKYLYKYNPSTDSFDYVSCGKSECGHSENFKKVLPDGKCWVCALREMITFIAH